MIDIKPSQRNTNKHTKDGMDLLENSINKVGVIESISVASDGTIISGHARFEHFEKQGKKPIEIHLKENEYPVIVTDIENNSKEYFEAQILANTTANKNFDLDIEMIEVIAEEFDIDIEEVGVEVVEVEDDTILEAEEDDFDATPPTIAKTVLGDLYEIGEHRLLCGDSTCSDAVAKLMNGKKADMVFTDPPYLMDFTGSIHADGSKGFNSTHGGIKNDKMSKEDGDDFLDAINANIQLFTKGAFYICFYRLKLGEYFESLKRTGLEVRALITWNKGNHTLSNSDYMSKCEHIFYGWVTEHNFYGGNNGMDVWDIPRTQKNELHPTMKPIPLCEKAINDASKVNDLVFDLFLGSGSTMVASHQLKRKCYGMELDCKYCDVIVARMIKLDSTLPIKRNGVLLTNSEVLKFTENTSESN